MYINTLYNIGYEFTISFYINRLLNSIKLKNYFKLLAFNRKSLLRSEGYFSIVTFAIVLLLLLL